MSEIIEILQKHLVYFSYYFTVQIELIYKYWLIGMIIGSLISVFGKNKIHALFNALQKKNLGALGIFPASLLGIISPL